MKYSISTFLWTAAFDESNLALLPQLKEHGCDGVEIARFDYNDFPATKIRRELERTGLECTMCFGLSGEYSLIDDDSSVRQKTLSFLRQLVQIAAELGATTLAGVFWSPVGYLCGRRRSDEEWQYAIEGLQLLGDTLAQCEIMLALEPVNRFENYFLNTAADAVALCEAVNHPNVGMMIDLFHANIEEKDIAEAIRSSSRYLKHLHVCENDRGIPGTGHVPWDSVFAALEEVQYDRWATIESFNFSVRETAAMGRIWRNLASTPEAIAYEGLAFLKQHAKGCV
ncbi:sugar phosphate isomerase/epimerase [Microcoleus sp. FACHB-53]|jgi:D-psicose/D-tagatose/L-ribulose 3-epimerase|nr:sugar phosphate isomerase/epimerase [Microcoleus sp. FACHB-53]